MSSFEFYHRQDFPDEHYNVLGRLLVEFQVLESSITHALCILIKLDNDSRFIDFTFTMMNELPFKNRLKLLSNFIETHPEIYFVPYGMENRAMYLRSYKEDIGKLKEGIKLALSLEEKRNRIMHSLWLPAPKHAPQKTVTRIKVSTTVKKTKNDYEFISSSQILSIVEEIKEASHLIGVNAWYLEYLLKI